MVSKSVTNSLTTGCPSPPVIAAGWLAMQRSSIYSILHLNYIWIFNCISTFLSSTCTLFSIMHFIFLYNWTVKLSFHWIPSLCTIFFPTSFMNQKKNIFKNIYLLQYFSGPVFILTSGGTRKEIPLLLQQRIFFFQCCPFILCILKFMFFQHFTYTQDSRTIIRIFSLKCSILLIYRIFKKLY